MAFATVMDQLEEDRSRVAQLGQSIVSEIPLYLSTTAHSLLWLIFVTGTLKAQFSSFQTLAHYPLD